MNVGQASAVLGTFLFALNTYGAQLLNLASEYDTFVKAAEGQDASSTVAEWLQFEARHQNIYDDAVYRKSEPGWQKRIEQRRSQFFAEYEKFTPQMKALFAKAEDVVQEQEARFRRVFPDLSPTIPIVFMPSLFAFNGKVQFLRDYGRPGLLMGVDFIVKRNDNLNVLFSHEFFHAYHHSHLAEGSTGKTMATPLWKEGFATYVSGVLNPREADEVLLMDSALAKACADSQAVSKMASEFLNVIDSDGTNSYGDWFTMTGATQPTRRGYCLGLIVIRELVKKYPVIEMVNWDEGRFSQEARAVLLSLKEPLLSH
jgi:hypothetical protein